MEAWQRLEVTASLWKWHSQGSFLSLIQTLGVDKMQAKQEASTLESIKEVDKS